MASPFRYFRKHTKVFLAVAAVLAIFIFVVGDAIRTGDSGGGGATDATATVATWKGGKLNAGQLQSLVSQRMLTDQFLRRLFVQGGGESEYDFPPNLPQLLLSREQGNQIEGVVVSTEVLASLATQAGMTVSDSLINHYIQEMGLRSVGGDQVVQILDNIGQGNPRANESIVFNTLRKMLLAYFYRRTFDDASLVVLPQERWDDWRKVNERISVEAAVLPTEKFIGEVKEPTEAEIAAFYEAHKDADPGRYAVEGGRELPLADPGFAVPRRMRVQYLLGSSAERAEKLLEKVTEEEIKDYYERNKRLEFTKMDLPGEESFGGSEAEEPATTPPPTTDGAPAEPAPSETAPANGGETPETPPAASGPSDGGETTPPAPATPETGAPSEGAPAPPATPAPAEATPSAPAPAEGAGANESSSQVVPKSPFRLAAFQQPSEEAPSSEAPAEAAGADAATAEPASETPAAATDSTPAAGAEAAASSASTPETPATPAGIDPAAALPADDDTQYEPLDSVREEIRKKLATDKAVQELERVMSEATAELQSEFSRYTSQVAAAQDKNAKAPAPSPKLTDLTWLADKYQLKYEKTTPLTIRELFDTAVGKAVDTASQQTNVTQAAYESLQLYEPMLAREVEGDWYLVSKIEDTPRRIPPLKEVHDQVVEAWKKAEAAKLAEKKAKELAAEISKSGAPFDQFFFAEHGFEVIKSTAFFSWRTYPAGQVGMGRPPAISDVPELKNVGENFMEAAFSLQDKEAVAVQNYDKSATYVIRLARRQYSEEELRALFLKEEGSWLGRADMRFAHASAFNDAVNNEILKERGQLEFNEEWLAERARRMEERNN